MYQKKKIRFGMFALLHALNKKNNKNKKMAMASKQLISTLSPRWCDKINVHDHVYT